MLMQFVNAVLSGRLSARPSSPHVVASDCWASAVARLEFLPCKNHDRLRAGDVVRLADAAVRAGRPRYALVGTAEDGREAGELVEAAAPLFVPSDALRAALSAADL